MSEATMTFREDETTAIADGVPFVFVPPESFFFFYVHVEEQFDGSLWSGSDSFLVRRVLWAERLAEKGPHSSLAAKIL